MIEHPCCPHTHTHTHPTDCCTWTIKVVAQIADTRVVRVQVETIWSTVDRTPGISYCVRYRVKVVGCKDGNSENCMPVDEVTLGIILIIINSLRQNSITLSWSQTGPKLVADLQLAGIWPIIQLASSELARPSRSATSLGPVCDQDSVMEFGFEPICDQVRAGSSYRACRDSSNLLELGRRPVRSWSKPNSITLSWSQTGPRLVAVM